jgi:hypothetical protein
MSEPGDLHWEYLRAGLYETQFWCNGFRYKIEKDDYYNNEWRLYFIWYHSKKRPREWKRHGDVCKTKKEAQELARRHNIKPRQKYKYVGRVPVMGPLTENQSRIFRIARHYGDLMYCKVNIVDGQEKVSYTNAQYPNFIEYESVFVEFSELPPEHPARKELVDG